MVFNIVDFLTLHMYICMKQYVFHIQNVLASSPLEKTHQEIIYFSLGVHGFLCYPHPDTCDSRDN